MPAVLYIDQDWAVTHVQMSHVMSIFNKRKVITQDFTHDKLITIPSTLDALKSAFTWHIYKSLQIDVKLYRTVPVHRFKREVQCTLTVFFLPVKGSDLVSMWPSSVKHMWSKASFFYFNTPKEVSFEWTTWNRTSMSTNRRLTCRRCTSILPSLTFFARSLIQSRTFQ